VKHVVSVSLGSSKRDSTAQAVFLGEEFILERVGTDGDMQKAVQKIGELDGRVDAIGLGGIDLYLWTLQNQLLKKSPLASLLRLTYKRLTIRHEVDA